MLTSSLVVEGEHLPLHVQDGVVLKSQGGFMERKSQTIEQFEQQALSGYLAQAEGNVSRAATLARMPRRTFHRLMAKYRLSGHSVNMLH